MSVKEDQIPDINIDSTDDIRKKYEGELNTISLKDALKKLVEYAKQLEENPPKEEDDQ